MADTKNHNHEIDEEENANNDVPEYKVTEKKTVNEYLSLDAEDESLTKWKISLGIVAGNSIGDPSDKRRVVILELAIIVVGMEPMVFNLEDPKVLKHLKTFPTKIKEGSKYRCKVKFRIQHDIVTGLKYSRVAKRAGIPVNKASEVLGSYPPNTKENPFYIKEMEENEAPSGFLARAQYSALSMFSDDDKVVHFTFPWIFEVTRK